MEEKENLTLEEEVNEGSRAKKFFKVFGSILLALFLAVFTVVVANL